MYRYFSYDGPVLSFGKCVANRWKASTYAPSEQKARCNLAYRFKKETGKAPTYNVTLPGKLVITS